MHSSITRFLSNFFRTQINNLLKTTEEEKFQREIDEEFNRFCDRVFPENRILKEDDLKKIVFETVQFFYNTVKEYKDYKLIKYFSRYKKLKNTENNLYEISKTRRDSDNNFEDLLQTYFTPQENGIYVPKKINLFDRFKNEIPIIKKYIEDINISEILKNGVKKDTPNYYFLMSLIALNIVNIYKIDIHNSP